MSTTHYTVVPLKCDPSDERPSCRSRSNFTIFRESMSLDPCRIHFNPFLKVLDLPLRPPLFCDHFCLAQGVVT